VKKTTLIRSDKPHAVNMPAGSNVAARKTTQKFTEPATADETPTNVQKVVPVKVPKAKRITAPPPVAKTVRAKATKTVPPEAPPKIVKPKSTPAKAARSMPKLRNTQAPSKKAKAPEPDPTPIEAVWEQDNPIKNRIDQLRTRNAQLAEQLQRLPQTPTARGKRP
jgi:hypothetical protein